MGFDPHEPEQRRRLRAALKVSDVSIGELWLNYSSIGGAVGEYELEAYLQGLLSLPATQRDLLAMAANELIDRAPRIHAPYSDDLTTEAGPDPDRDDQQSANRETASHASANQESASQERAGQENADQGRSQSASDNAAGEEEPG
jgi:hypothetical protein